MVLNGASVFTNGPDEGWIQLNRETLEIDRTYSGNHTTDLVCFDVSNNAGNIPTIDEDGLILLWDTSSEQVAPNSDDTMIVKLILKENTFQFQHLKTEFENGHLMARN